MGGIPSRPDVPLLLVDGHNLLWRATFGFPAEIRSRDKTRLLTGVFGFFALLRVAVRDELAAPPEIVVVFDGEYGAADRQGADGGYKAQRPADDQALAPILHLPDVKRGLDLAGVAWIEVEDSEADDVIATVIHAAGTDRQTLVMSGDQDYYQLINDRVRILNTAMRPGRRLVDDAEVRGRYGVTPAQWPDYRALRGDPADNIPGVRGVGAVTAAALLAGGLRLDDLPASGRLRRDRRGPAVEAAWQQVLTWRDMIGLRTNAPLPLKPDGCPTPALPQAAQILEGLDLW
jgi:DNA polymerase-1